ncbi:hypothetical protein [Spirochaeta africana]|uniref:Fibronectin type-III domain-containing protein n=1 Tax=Spirochaeta africana (strain ATCC 700263 / DSM 8902 / Z-7692) TaxID=889378 RepID=H9UFZ4_SPIAZ|nr:hypothetical protein [Spirochaeta africana]AFG36437.1 hypothetical protein Spiaf_0331 [Spirochaeta africana DSM 8902]
MAVVLIAVAAGCASAPAQPAEPLEIMIDSEGPLVIYWTNRAFTGDFHITWSLDSDPEYPPRSQDYAVTRTAEQDMDYELVGFEGPGFYHVRVAAEVDGEVVYSDSLQLYLAGGTP